MKIVSYRYDIDVELYNGLNYIIIENKTLLREIIISLRDNIASDVGEFIFSDKNDIVSIKDNCEMIFDIFNIDFNSNTLLKKVYEDIGAEIYKNEDDKVIDETFEKINEMISEIYMSYDIDLIANHGYDITKLLKLCNIRIATDESNILECIIEYVKIMCRLNNKRVFIFTDLDSYFDTEELNILDTELKYYDIIAIVLGSSLRCSADKCAICFDDDLCRII